eukprot:10513451-Heterocapsa_arctica.AAC.1
MSVVSLVPAIQAGRTIRSLVSYISTNNSGIVGVMPANMFHLGIRINDPATGWDPKPGEEPSDEVAAKLLQRKEDKAYINTNVIPPLGIHKTVDD